MLVLYQLNTRKLGNRVEQESCLEFITGMWEESWDCQDKLALAEGEMERTQWRFCEVVEYQGEKSKRMGKNKEERKEGFMSEENHMERKFAAKATETVKYNFFEKKVTFNVNL